MENSTNETKRKDWSSLQLQKPLNPRILQSLYQNNFKSMLPVQQAAIPLMLKNYDLAVQAQTGSGKTLAFLIPLLQRLFEHSLESLSSRQEKGILAIKFVILSPTRQLCQQTYLVLTKLLHNISEVGQKYLQYCQCTTGGRPFQLDLQAIKEKAPLILISTIGRLKQLCEHQEQNWLKKVDYLYIDEADRVLKQKGVESVINKIQKMRRTAMFSATLAGIKPQHYKFFGMRNLAKISLKNVVQPNKNQIKTENQLIEKEKKLTNYIIPKTLKNTYVIFQNRLEKIYYLINLLNHLFVHKANLKIIVFFNTCASVDYYNKLLNSLFQTLHPQEQLFSSIFIGLHGKLKPKRRKALLTKFTTDNTRPYCLLATDVVARGIDFDSIEYIVQVDPPEDPDNYVHRIGRTARVDKQGTALLLLQEHQNCFIKFLNNQGVAIEQYQAESFIKQELGMNKKKKKKQQISYLTKEQLQQSIMNSILQDRDYTEKAKKAFVSYLRSYKQHDLKYIFQFKNMDIGSTAHSFFLLRLPRVKEILGKKIENFTQSQINPETIPWQDKNQQLQYLKKRQKIQAVKVQKQKQQRRLQQKQDIKNNKSKRKRQKSKKQAKDLKMINKEHNLLRKQKKSNYIQQIDIQSDDFSDDTEEIEKRVQQKIRK